jgi:hypothetical protein
VSTPPGWTPDPRERDDEPGRPAGAGPADGPPPADPTAPLWNQPAIPPPAGRAPEPPPPPGYGTGSDPGGQPPGHGTGSEPASAPWAQRAAPPGHDPDPEAAGQPPGYGTGSGPASPPWQQAGQGGHPGYPPPGPPGHGGYGHPPRAGYGPPGGYPGHPGYPPAPDAQPRRNNRRVLALIAGLAVAAIVLFGAVAAVALRGNPRDTADEFMAALKAKDVDKAHSLLCKDGQRKESKAELRRGFDLDDRTITSYQLGTERTRQREGKDETLIPVTIDYDKGSEVKIDVGVWNEGGQKVCSLNPPGDA